VLAANTAAPASTMSVILCVGSTSIIASATAKLDADQLSKGLMSQTCSAVPSFPVIHNVFFTNHIHLIYRNITVT